VTRGLRASLPIAQARQFIGHLALVWATGACGATPQVAARTPCSEARGLAPSRDLYCIVLTAVPGELLSASKASLELNRIPSPFGANVTRDGTIAYAPVFRGEGLPAPAQYDSGARVWVAWITTPAMHPSMKLGVVDNGTATLAPRIDWTRFFVLVTAEKSDTVSAPDGKVALRGFSASWRMQPPDMTEFLYGALPATGNAAQDDGSHSAHAWTHPPMPRGLAMMPSEMRLAPPRTAPYLPQPAGEIPDAKPREVLQLADGDTVTLTAGFVRQHVAGQSFVGYGYNGQVPGPVLAAPEGAKVLVRYRNRIELPSTVHWHGVRLENRFDGVEGITQPAVLPGAQFDYEVHFRDAGLFWYHPHMREDLQKDLGLYGSMMVRPAATETGPANREALLMLDDIEMAPGGLVQYGTDRATHALMGRFGNVLLVNGRTDWSMDVARGEVVRFLLTNVTNARTFNVSFGNARVKVVGSDIGPFEREEWVESVVIAPAERYVVSVRFDSAGRVAIENRVHAIDHTFGRFFRQVDTLGTVLVSAAPASPDHRAAFDSLRPHPSVVRSIEPYRASFSRAVDKELVVRLQADSLPFVVDRFLRFDSVYFHPVEWSGTMPMMNWNATSKDVTWILEEPSTGRRNMDIRWDFRTGDVVKVRIANVRETLHGMQHPIHFHGQRFLVLEQNGVRNTNLAWKDTFLLPAGHVADILLEISNPGTWMAHCHVAEHMASGMMMTFTVK
jgi:FtsP/CotA-like multicopper oxidase with cupredoxin domain